MCSCSSRIAGGLDQSFVSIVLQEPKRSRPTNWRPAVYMYLHHRPPGHTAFMHKAFAPPTVQSSTHCSIASTVSWRGRTKPGLSSLSYWNIYSPPFSYQLDVALFSTFYFVDLTPYLQYLSLSQKDSASSVCVNRAGRIRGTASA